jgi:hypothetical protein
MSGRVSLPADSKGRILGKREGNGERRARTPALRLFERCGILPRRPMRVAVEVPPRCIGALHLLHTAYLLMVVRRFLR